MKVQAKAQVQVTLNISLSQPWNGEDQIQSVFKLGAEEAVDKLSYALQMMPERANIVGKPKVIGIITECANTQTPEVQS